MAIAVSDSQDHFVRDGRPFFYLADTAWSAFTNPTIEEWEQYLDYRGQQGFNALQINILPQWDRSRGQRDAESRRKLEPFPLKADGSWDFRSPNDDYFRRAHQMTAMAVDRGFVPALVVLWCDFVPGTWGSKRLPQHAMTQESMKSYIEYAIPRFSEFEPVYLVSGDTDLITREAVDAYLSALEIVKANSPGCLTTLHTSPVTDLPEEIVQSPHLDFYMYQSGHSKKNRNLTFGLAERYCAKTVKRPVVNGEPCYEAHGIVNGEGRYDALQVRRAVWQSLLSGAKAGVTYGAHGIWPWHREDSEFPPKRHSALPLPWSEALRLRGAWDVSWARWLFEAHGLFDLEPAQELLVGDRESVGLGGGAAGTAAGTGDAPIDENIRLSASGTRDKVAFYAPYTVEVHLGLDLAGYECVLFNLEERCAARPPVLLQGGESVVMPGTFNSDALFLAVKQAVKKRAGAGYGP